MTLVLEVLSWLLLGTGSVLLVIGAIGLHRLPDFFSRTHAAGITDTGAAGLILLGLILQAGLSLVAVKLLLILLFLWFTSPTASHNVHSESAARETFANLRALCASALDFSFV